MNNIIVTGKIINFLSHSLIQHLMFEQQTRIGEFQVSFIASDFKEFHNYLPVRLWGNEMCDILDLYELNDYVLIEGYLSNQNYVNSLSFDSLKEYNINLTALHPLYIQDHPSYVENF
uniref:Conserved hypothetical plastid protein n=1 Tax=Olisthodiscus luteus TaxID=83000 RepID=A0A7U0KSM3_OLILU|nr:conserved hypothetical plastid protein [Olisthodiscus luteus]YP_010152840.1 conserved hypothetical plastid protein [Olisthodiscus luteus]QQW50451.1 conserved hypothetical plastid protein [Olisthodiscus luteus]QQW50501.1 conserved hypothetical plastid protein [Olisthodiscus luteus]